MNFDLTDIQGNLLRAYAYPHTRYVFLNLRDADKARAFIAAVIPHITNSEIWADKKPPSTLNFALSRTALTALELPLATINSFPVEFLEGMAARATALGDVGDSAPDKWEAMWQGRVDLWMSINALTQVDREQRYAQLVDIVSATEGAEILGYQNGDSLVIDGNPCAKEHFGYSDGYSQPDFYGSHSENTPGDGKINHGGWKDLADGEFILGYANEALELQASPLPETLSKNGSFLVYRKLEQDVKGFRDYVNEWGPRYPGGSEKLMAKFVGRWRDGTPLALSPDSMDATLASDIARNNDFTYADDPEGVRCPIGAHVRRANPRDSIGFRGKLASRRRILRRGIPYGPYVPEGQPVDDQERGIVFMVLNANINRQFEFVQQQWINYGNDFHLGEDSDPLLGNRSNSPGRFVIPGDPAKGEKTFVCSGMQSFVTLRGGDYFFLPSLTALQLLAFGMVDPR